MSRRAKRVILFIFILIPMLMLPFLTGHAENYPDISNLDPSYVLNSNRQFFSRPNGGYALISTDAVKKSRVTLLDGSGNPDVIVDFCVADFSFVYEKTYQDGEYLYFVGRDATRDDRLKIVRFQLTDGFFVTNLIDKVTCDFTREFSVNADGKFRLVTVPYGSVPGPNSPVWIYTFIPDHEGAYCAGEPAPDPVSSSDPEESSGSLSSESSSQAESGGESSTPAESSPEVPPARPFVFQEPITVESLQKQIDSEGRGDKVHVIGSDGYEVKTGRVGTGATIEVLRAGKLQSHVIAVVLGDLTGSGEVTELDGSAVYEYITNQKNLTGYPFQAADINGDGKIDTSDLLQLKNRMK